ncbi:hypothetical protein LCGC14_0570730 [marine sediment metagenome]|uniref:Uncharacterized protein n=1 Tax=marine sediment metagenome TaxID=412755 RepID=A0A0F9USJ2_9ZZZZ
MISFVTHYPLLLVDVFTTLPMPRSIFGSVIVLIKLAFININFINLFELFVTSLMQGYKWLNTLTHESIIGQLSQI